MTNNFRRRGTFAYTLLGILQQKFFWLGFFFVGFFSEKTETFRNASLLIKFHLKNSFLSLRNISHLWEGIFDQN